MSIRRFKTTLKQLEAADKVAKEMMANVIADERISEGESLLREYAEHAVFIARKLYERAKLIERSMHRQKMKPV